MTLYTWRFLKPADPALILACLRLDGQELEGLGDGEPAVVTSVT